MPAAGRIGGWVAFRGGLVYVSNLLQENFYMLLPLVLNSNLYCINLRVYLATLSGSIRIAASEPLHDTNTTSVNNSISVQPCRQRPGTSGNQSIVSRYGQEG